MIKEKLQEEWGKHLRTAQTPNSFEDMALDFFYSKLQEIRSEDRRVFRDNIISKVQIFEADLQSRLGVNDTFEIEDKIEAVRKILDLIKQNNDR